MTLYREATDVEVSNHPEVQTMDVVPVEPCDHGNYDRHLLTILENHERVWCEGEPA